MTLKFHNYFGNFILYFKYHMIYNFTLNLRFKMKINLSHILIALIGINLVIHAAEVDYMKKALDDIEVHYNGAGHTFNQTFYDKFQTCLDMFGDDKLKNT